MCVMSMTGNYFEKTLPQRYDWIQPYIQQPYIYPEKNNAVTPHTTITIGNPVIAVTREEFEALKKDVIMMKELLMESKKYDEENGEPDCEIEEKMEKLRAIAAIVGVDLDEVLGKKK